MQVLISFDVMGFDLHEAMYSRVLDTLIGAAIAWFAVSYLWPDWKYLQLDKVSRQAIKSNAKSPFISLVNYNLVKEII
ncbi:YccS/YhfK family integral membrane protein [Pasteurella canis]|uniref:YccS/YhfK family integral membrane protein n=1 Tax=Pasteurella canis TaxID=753 RepID=A0A379GF29_9PAST|nr:YccS/YhfK family integral membrane protein [Pasteurella canis]